MIGDNGKGGRDRMYENMYEKMIAVTNRHLVLENDTDGAYLKQLTYVASLHPKAMVLREKDLTEEKYEELAKVVIKLCEKAGTTLILHRFPEVVHHLGYDKLHLPLEMLKTIGRPEGLTLLGTSIHSVEDAKEAERLGADYVFAGNIFETDCKKGLPGRGLEFLENVCKEVDIPVYAISRWLYDVWIYAVEGKIKRCFCNEIKSCLIYSNRCMLDNCVI